MFSAKRNSTADDVRKVLLTALIAALEDQKETKKPRRGITGVRALATGAVLYTAGRAGSKLLTDRVQSGSDEDEAEADEEYEDEEYDEPEAEYDEDEAEADEDEADEEYEDEDEEYEEPEAEADEEEGEEYEEYEEEPEAEADEPEYDEDEQDDIPERPSRSRSPVGRS